MSRRGSALDAWNGTIILDTRPSGAGIKGWVWEALAVWFELERLNPVVRISFRLGYYACGVCQIGWRRGTWSTSFPLVSTSPCQRVFGPFIRPFASSNHLPRKRPHHLPRSSKRRSRSRGNIARILGNFRTGDAATRRSPIPRGFHSFLFFHSAAKLNNSIAPRRMTGCRAPNRFLAIYPV